MSQQFFKIHAAIAISGTFLAIILGTVSVFSGTLGRRSQFIRRTDPSQAKRVLNTEVSIIPVANADFTAAATVTISGRVKNVNQRGLTGEKVELSVNGVVTDSKQTDATGAYSFTVTLGGTYDVA